MNCETSQSGECVLRLGCRLPPVPEVAGFRLAFITSDTKHVQTELNEDEYERFREFASEHGLAQGSRPRGAHRVDRTPAATDPDDPAFSVLDDFEGESLSASAATDAREKDNLADERHGGSAPFQS